MPILSKTPFSRVFPNFWRAVYKKRGNRHIFCEICWGLRVKFNAVKILLTHSLSNFLPVLFHSLFISFSWPGLHSFEPNIQIGVRWMKEEGGGGGDSKVALGCQDVTCAFSMASAFSVTFENIKHKIRLLYLTTSMENSSFCLKVWSGMFAAITSKDVHVDLLYFCLSGMAIFGTWIFRKLFNFYIYSNISFFLFKCIFMR